MVLIYGIDTNKPYTAHDVRNALEQCFIDAHRKDQEKELEEIVKGMGQQSVSKLAEANIKIIVKDAFKETGGNIDEPTKKSIIKAMDYLRNFSKHYRSMDIIVKHYNEMMQLVNGIKE